MPLRLNVGVSRKVGQPDYGSLGASCNVEVELDAGLLQDPEQLQGRVRDAYVAAHRAVHDELARLQGTAKDPALELPRRAGPTRDTRPAPRASTTTPPATDNQLRAIRALARRRGLDLADVLRAEFDAAQPEDLSLREASRLIDLLKETAAV